MSDRSEDSRVRALQATHLLDTAPEVAFDRLTRLAAGLLGAPIALVTLVDARRQFFKSAFGLSEPWASRRETPLTHSFCKYVTRGRGPLVINDAREEPSFRDNLAVVDLGAVAYLGIPLVVAGEVIGAFCVVDSRPRAWSEDEIRLLTDLAGSVGSEIELRVALRVAREQHALTDALLESLGDGVLAIDTSRTFVIANAAARRVFADGAVAGQPLPADWSAIHRSRRADGSPLAPEDGALARGLRGADTDCLEFTLERPGAPEALWMEATGRPVLGVDGKVIAAVAVYRDVTERKGRADIYAALASNIPRCAVALFDRELRCVAIDGGMRIGDVAPSSTMIGQSMRQLAGYAPGDAAFDHIEDVYRRTLAGESVSLDFVHGQTTLALHTAPVRDGLGRVSTGIVLALDVTAERCTEVALRRSEQIYRAIAQNLPMGAVLMVDHDLRYVAADGPIVGDILRRANLTEIVGFTVSEMSSEANMGEIIEVYRSALAGEPRQLEIRRGDRFYDLHVVPIFEGARDSHALVFLFDVTTRKAELTELETARVALERQALVLREASVTDELTGLLNRRGFLFIGEQLVKVAARNKQNLVLFFADLNGMKAINDTLGHKAGDRALVDTASILRRVFRTSDVIARLGGDEFVVLAIDAVTTSGSVLAARLGEAIGAYNASSPSFQISLSVGTSTFDPARPSTLANLLAEADACMYADKRGPRGDPAGDPRVRPP